jgi:hypothetical protein
MVTGELSVEVKDSASEYEFRSCEGDKDEINLSQSGMVGGRNILIFELVNID